MAEPRRERPLKFDRRMSDAEALMWNVEKDPALRSSFLNVTFLDGPPDVDRFRLRMQVATEKITRLRQRVVAPPFNLAPPEWTDDPSFDPEFHVRHVAVPAPGTDRQLLDLAALLYQDPFDRARPLWQFTIVDGLEGGRAALLAKMHHTITDGVGGIRLSAMFIDAERDAPDPAPAGATAGSPGALVPPAEADGLLEQLRRAVGHEVRRQLGAAQRMGGALAGSLRHPLALPGRVGDTVATVQSLSRQLGVTDPSRSPLWTGRRSLGRRFEILRVELESTKRAAKALGGTVNDAFVTGVAGGIGAYHRALGAEVGELRMAMPVNLRDDRSAGGNAFAPTRLLVPAGIKDPVERFAAVQGRLRTTKRERALGLVESFAGVLNNVPTGVLARFARQQAEAIDFATSNLRGAPFDLFVAGARVLANHPMGPTAGTACNATVLSYCDSLDIGLNLDTAAVDDPELLRACIEESFAELIDAAG